MKYEDGSIIIQGCFSANSIVTLHAIKKYMNGEMYWETLEEKWISAKQKKKNDFRQNNDPKHTVELNSERFLKK